MAAILETLGLRTPDLDGYLAIYGAEHGRPA
jgi:hypothetical protein